MRIIASLVLLVILGELVISFYSRLAANSSAGEPNLHFDVWPLFGGHSFKNPIGLQHAGDSRIFLAEQAGKIKFLSMEAPASEAEIFLDISPRVKSGGEQGLLGFAFHPAFQKNGEVFVHYSSLPKGDTTLSRFRLDPDNSNRLNPASEEILLRVEQPYANHNGGQIAFGPDGFLYFALGDGGSADDPHGNGQNLNTLLGKILRLDVDHPANGKPYGIPADNPFISRGGARPEIFAYGLRNPWRFSFDRKTGRLWAADVGQDRHEEIDLIEKGRNYGWNIMEGPSCSASWGCKTNGLEMPIFDYGRDAGGSITGGFVYRGTKLPALIGKYIYGDFVSGRIWALDAEKGKVNNFLLAETKLLISSFGEDSEGELYILSYGDGKLYSLNPH